MKYQPTKLAMTLVVLFGVSAGAFHAHGQPSEDTTATESVAVTPGPIETPSLSHSSEVPVADISTTVEAPPALEGASSVPGVTATDLSDDPISAVSLLVKSVRDGDWKKFAAVALSLMMLGLGRYRDKIPWFSGDRGGVVLVFTLSATGALVTSLLAGAPVDAIMFFAAADVGLLAIGGFVAIKKVFFPGDTA